jgi:hypothetical protein
MVKRPRFDLSSVGEAIVDMLKSSVIVQSTLSLMIVTTICGMIWAGKAETLPKEFWIIAGSIIGYWFGSKADYGVTRRFQEIRKMIQLQLPRDQSSTKAK